MRKYLPLLLALLSVPALAQDAGSINDRLERMQRDITYLQRQVYRGAASDPNAAAPATGGGTEDAQLLVQISQLQEEIRSLRGTIEQVQYEQNKIKADMKSLNEDVDYRLKALEEAVAANKEAIANSSDAVDKAVPEENPTAEEEKKTEDKKPEADSATATATDTKKFRDSDTHYNYAFDLLNKKQYGKSAAAFAGFVRNYPKDPLVPNALYWQGESYYAQGDYVRAADGFRRGYEAAPNGQKAPDNLLKLGLSLANVKRKDEACVVLGQVTSKYTQKSFAATRDRAEQAKGRLGCGK